MQGKLIKPDVKTLDVKLHHLSPPFAEENGKMWALEESLEIACILAFA